MDRVVKRINQICSRTEHFDVNMLTVYCSVNVFVHRYMPLQVVLHLHHICPANMLSVWLPTRHPGLVVEHWYV